MRKKLCVLLAVLMMVVMCFAGCGSKDPDIGVKTGDTMPDFTVTLTDGTDVSLHELLEENDLVVLNVFASWCHPCENEFPEMESVYQANRDQMVILSVSFEPADTLQIISDYKESHNLSFPMSIKSEDMSFLSISSFPTTMFIDHNGKIGFIKVGAFLEEGEFEERVNYFISPDYNGQALDNEVAFSITPIILLGLPFIWLLAIISRWVILHKAGRHGWYSLIPFLSSYQEYDICWKGWVGIVTIIDVILVLVVNMLQNNNIFADGALPTIIRVALGCCFLALTLIQSIKLAKAFGKGKGVGIVLWFTSFLGRLVLGITKAKYQGKEN